MGEENLEETKNNNNGGGGDGDGGNNANKNNNNQKKKESGSINVVFKVHMHCEGCVTKLVKSAQSFNGVESVKAESENSKLTVTGRVDPAKLLNKLKKSKKEILLISPLPKKENKTDVKPEPKIKEPPVTTVVLKVAIHCHGCFEKIEKTIIKFKGVHTSSIDQQKDLVTVTGTMDVKALQAALMDKVKRAVEIVPPKKEKVNSNEGNGEGGKNQKGGGGGGGGGGKKNENDGNGGGGKTEVNLMQYYGYGYEYGPGYIVEPIHPPQLFSDENPNACSIM